MSNVIVISIAMFCSVGRASSLQFVDVGFRNLDKHISIELTSANGQDAYAFNLTSDVGAKSVAISKCVYSEAALRHELSNVRDDAVRADLRWIFKRSDYSATPIETFYPEFADLLRRANGACEVPDLRWLTDQLDTQKG